MEEQSAEVTRWSNSGIVCSPLSAAHNPADKPLLCVIYRRMLSNFVEKVTLSPRSDTVIILDR